MIFWTACHEMGHAFNLAHSWQKALGKPWIPLTNVGEERSFMNYPFRVAGGQHAFFSDFEFRFSDDELLFMRHAPERFVQHGNADWFDDHGFRQASVAPVPTFRLELRVHRAQRYFEFMEPVTIEAKLTNISAQPQIVDEHVLLERHEMTVIIKKLNRPAQQWRPFAQYLYHADKKVLAAGASVYAPLLLSTGPNGWDISEPGVYTVQIALHMDGEDVVSNPLQIQVAPPRSRDEELVAQDYFTEDVGRVLALKGSRFLNEANDTLRRVVDQFEDRAAAAHARLALGNPLMHPYRLLVADGDAEAAAAAGPEQAPQKLFQSMNPNPDQARHYLSEALFEKPQEAADTLGHIEYRSMAMEYGSFLGESGETKEAASCLHEAKEVLASRKVIQSALDEMDDLRQQYE